jgi:imidazole glycerol-phosphate synthase subunit HisF
MIKRNSNPIRIIPILDIKNGLLIKGINLEGLRVLGKAKDFSNYYYKNGADEICYIDNVATLYGTNNLSNFITDTAKDVFIPLSVGGGIRSIEDMKKMFSAGADKICINSSIIENPNLLDKAAKIFGSANITIMIQSIKIDNKYFISKANGRDLANIDPIIWAKKVENYGAGEIILTSVNNEGLKNGFDITLTNAVSGSVNIPVIAHGGAGSFKDIYDVISKTKISGVGLASILHYEALNYFPKFNPKVGNTTFLENIVKSKKKKNIIQQLKNYLRQKNIKVRHEKK